ncbi:MAG: ATP-binding protein [Thermomicrobiales bacterium]
MDLLAMQQSLAALQAETRALRETLDLMDEALWSVDHDWRLHTINAAAERIWGRSREDLLGQIVWDVFPEVVGTPIHTAIMRARRSGVTQSFSARSPAVRRWLSGHAHPTADGLIVHFQDITQMREDDLARQQSEERYRAVLETIDEGFCLIEMIFADDGAPLDYRFLETNDAFETHTGLHNAVGKTAREMVPGLDDDWFETYGRVAVTGEPVRFVDDAPAMDGRWFDVYAFRLGGPGSDVVGILFTNITQRKHLERLQQDFVAMASHDLAGPVTVLRARAQLMQRRQVYDDASMDAIIEQTKRMERLIDDLRELVRLETSNVDLRRSEVDLAALAADAIDRMRLQAPGHTLRLQGEADVHVCADKDRLAQVLDNLLGNAVKYSPAGGVVTITLSRCDNTAQLAVADKGPGIEPAAVPHLFDRFYRANARDVAAGLGLGLYITRMLVEAHGGEIRVESTLGVGSTFIVTLPMAATAELADIPAQ